MRKLALVVGAFGLLSFAGIARADHQKTENSEKTETSTTLGGKHKTTRDKKIERADGSSVETKSETTRPKASDRDAVDTDKRDDMDSNVKTESKTTLTGKRKTTRSYDAPDGTHTETTTTTTDPDRK